MGVYINLIVLFLFLSFFRHTSFQRKNCLYENIFLNYFLSFLVINSLFFRKYLYFSKFIPLLILENISSSNLYFYCIKIDIIKSFSHSKIAIKVSHNQFIAPTQQRLFFILITSNFIFLSFPLF